VSPIAVPIFWNAPRTKANPRFLRSEALHESKTVIWKIDKAKGTAYLESNEFKPGNLELPLRQMLGCSAVHGPSWSRASDGPEIANVIDREFTIATKFCKSYLAAGR
jgi:hypothetical protein